MQREPTANSLYRLLLDPAMLENLAAYRQHGGYSSQVWQLSPEQIRATISESGLTGRGGSQFPTGRKLDTVASLPGEKIVLVNGAETEPASQKDRTLLQHRPHLLLEGALLAARAIGASRCVLYLPEHDPSVRQSIEGALRELHHQRLSVVQWRIVTAPRRYVAGEETAAISRASGKDAKPTMKPPYPAERGVGGYPTLVQNVETLANFPRILSEGALAFRALGVKGQPGTALVTITGSVRRPGVYEVPNGALFTDILTLAGAPDPAQIQAVLPGGIFAGWLPGQALTQGVRLEREGLRSFGASTGAGAITVIANDVCGLCQVVAALTYFARESVRQCGPCTFGTQALAQLMNRVARGEGDKQDLIKIERYATTMLPRRGACGHLDGAATAARTALLVFEREIAHHIRRGKCGRPWRLVIPGLAGVRAG